MGSPTREELELYKAALNKLGKWRSILCGWFMGTRSDKDEQAKAYKDLIERSLIMRAELTGLTRLLVGKGLIEEWELLHWVAEEAAELEKMLEKQFPGYKASALGMDIDVRVAAQTSLHWPK